MMRRMQWPPAVALALVAGCYSPHPPEGAPCGTARDCPFPQRCVLGSCTEHDAGDAAVPDARNTDAATDATIDAMVLPCATTGLSCGGAATMFSCGGHCWVRCTGGAAWTAAGTACAGWQGALGEIDDATEQSCVASRASTPTWLGLNQSAAATTPGQGWAWNTSTAPLGFTQWHAGKPDDADGNENHQEQCGKIQVDGTWDDDPCSEPLDFFCERP
jgi:hypothetical protein